MAVRHQVEDFGTWRSAYDEHGKVRDSLGCMGDRILRDEAEPNDVLVLTYWPTLDSAHAFAEDPALPEVMHRAGVVGAPRIEIYEEAGA